MDLNKFKTKANKAFKDYKKMVVNFKKYKPSDLDEKADVFSQKNTKKYNCLECSNCCRTISPIITNKDIANISSKLKVRQADFTDKYLFIDDDGDYVFKSQPCPFIDENNYCIIYSFRPKACADYPHVESHKFSKILDLSLKNSLVCPIVNDIFEDLKNNFK